MVASQFQSWLTHNLELIQVISFDGSFFSELDFQNNPLVHYSDGYFEFLKLVLPNSKFDKILLLENGEKKDFFNYVTHHNDAYGTVLNSLPFFGSHGGPIASNNFFKEKLIEKIKLNLSEINLASHYY